MLPGNHDHRSPGQDPLWPVFREACGDRVLVLDGARPYPLAHYDLDACLYPGPCRSLHSAANAVGWVKAAGRHPDSRHHVGVAHGSLAGVSPDLDQSYYPMREAELVGAGLDLWVLGHTHLRYPERPGRVIVIVEELKKEKYDLIHAETFYVMPHLGKTSVPTILVEQTIWHDVYKHYVMHKVPLLLRPFFLQDVAKIKYWEKYYWSKADRLFGVSKEDREEMRKLVPQKEVGIIPNGVDTKHYREKIVKKYKPARILYGVTNFEWLQNEEATEILIKKVWPLIKKKMPDVKIWIVGRKIPLWIKKESKNGEILVSENIPDARDAYKGATIMVAPIRGAGGTRLKILEAMAAELPVVSTKVGVAGLDLEDGKNVLIADDPKDIAEKAVKLLKNSKLTEKIGIEGRKHVEKYFDWKKVVKLHDPVYKKLVKNEKD